MIKKIVCNLIAMMTIYSGFVAAETGAYQIELIVFSQLWPNTEVFDQTISKIEWPNNLTELSAYPQAKKVLGESVAALSKNSAYQPILHTAWIQAIGENSPSDPVHIQSGDGKINGYIQMQRGQTLQLMVDLEYTPGQTDNNGESYSYRLHEQRQFQLNDTQYLDHPMFGAITKISLHSQ